MTALLHPSYFPNIANFVAIANTDHLVLEMCDNYQKQTYRNRMHIYDANGKLPLTIPVVYSQKNRQLYKDIRIANDENWQILHWKAIQSAYSSSPFFEFYELDLKPLYESDHKFLMDFNLKCLEILSECLQTPLTYTTTKSYQKEVSDQLDGRFLVNSRKEVLHNFESYVQVFDDKHGFISNLSILDLICNEGPNAMMYLEAQTLLY